MLGRSPSGRGAPARGVSLSVTSYDTDDDDLRVRGKRPVASRDGSTTELSYLTGTGTAPVDAPGRQIVAAALRVGRPDNAGAGPLHTGGSSLGLTPPSSLPRSLPRHPHPTSGGDSDGVESGSLPRPGFARGARGSGARVGRATRHAARNTRVAGRSRLGASSGDDAGSAGASGSGSGPRPGAAAPGPAPGPDSASRSGSGSGSGTGAGVGAGAGGGAPRGGYRPPRATGATSRLHTSMPAETEPSPMDEDLFNTADEGCTPQLPRTGLTFKPPEKREAALAPASSVARPDFDDSLRRCSVVMYQHIIKGEKAREDGSKSLAGGLTAARSTSGFRRGDTGFAVREEKRGDGDSVSSGESEEESDISDLFHESLFVKAQYRYTFLRVPRMGIGTCYKMEKVEPVYKIPTVNSIYQFARHLFVKAQMSAECSIVCLIYVERLMKNAGLLVLASNWRPVLLCGMLLASKVWQDLNAWNVEFAQVYPQYTLESINRLEREFIQALRWDLFISGSLYAKYYFALRSMSEQKNFRRRYMYIVNVNVPGSKRVADASRSLKKELYSKSV